MAVRSGTDIENGGAGLQRLGRGKRGTDYDPAWLRGCAEAFREQFALDLARAPSSELDVLLLMMLMVMMMLC
eukprot:981337-Rhodomonas_salina.3